jgi:hypothetical protein
MGLRFRKIIPFAKGLKLNLSKSGVSISAGKAGSIFNVGLRGIRASIGKPGTGLGYQEYTPWGQWKWPFIIVAIVVVAVLVFG